MAPEDDDAPTDAPEPEPEGLNVDEDDWTPELGPPDEPVRDDEQQDVLEGERLEELARTEDAPAEVDEVLDDEPNADVELGSGPDELWPAAEEECAPDVAVLVPLKAAEDAREPDETPPDDEDAQHVCPPSSSPCPGGAAVQPAARTDSAHPSIPAAHVGQEGRSDNRMGHPPDWFGIP